MIVNLHFEQPIFIHILEPTEWPFDIRQSLRTPNDAALYLSKFQISIIIYN